MAFFPLSLPHLFWGRRNGGKQACGDDAPGIYPGGEEENAAKQTLQNPEMSSLLCFILNGGLCKRRVTGLHSMVKETPQESHNHKEKLLQRLYPRLVSLDRKILNVETTKSIRKKSVQTRLHERLTKNKKQKNFKKKHLQNSKKKIL